VLDAIFVWHGKGSLDEERHAALGYAKSMCVEGTSIQEFNEGNEDPMFWMFLGEEAFAGADFWKFRRREGGMMVRSLSRLYSVDVKERRNPVRETHTFF